MIQVDRIQGTSDAESSDCIPRPTDIVLQGREQETALSMARTVTD